MKLVYTDPNPSGAYPPIQEGNFEKCPEGMAEWPEELGTETFYQYNGFVKLTVEDGKVKDCRPDVEAWEAWKADHPEPGPEPEPEPTSLEERVEALEGGKADRAEVDAVWNQLAEAYREGVNEA